MLPFVSDRAPSPASPPGPRDPLPDPHPDRAAAVRQDHAEPDGLPRAALRLAREPDTTRAGSRRPDRLPGPPPPRSHHRRGAAGSGALFLSTGHGGRGSPAWPVPVDGLPEPGLGRRRDPVPRRPHHPDGVAAPLAPGDPPVSRPSSRAR